MALNPPSLIHRCSLDGAMLLLTFLPAPLTPYCPQRFRNTNAKAQRGAKIPVRRALANGRRVMALMGQNVPTPLSSPPHRV